jgi:hypothetical protein
MVDRPVDQAASVTQPEGPVIFPPGSKAIGANVPRAMPFAHRLCPHENLVRQNDPIQAGNALAPILFASVIFAAVCCILA